MCGLVGSGKGASEMRMIKISPWLTAVSGIGLLIWIVGLLGYACGFGYVIGAFWCWLSIGDVF